MNEQVIRWLASMPKLEISLDIRQYLFKDIDIAKIVMMVYINTRAENSFSLDIDIGRYWFGSFMVSWYASIPNPKLIKG